MKSKTSKWYILFFICIYLQTFYVYSQVNKNGIPFIKNYTPIEYNAFAQNWYAVQDLRGIIYFANNFGIIEFDGSKWRKSIAKDGEIIRSLARDDEGIIYFGTSQRFGVMYPNNKGKIKLLFLSDILSITLKRNFEFWKIACVGDDIFFFSEKFLFRINKKLRTYHQWDLKNDIFNIYAYKEKLLLSSFSKGLMELQNDSITEIRSGRFFKDMAIVSVLPINNDSLLYVTMNNGIFKSSSNINKDIIFKPLNNKLLDYLSNKTIYTAVELKDKSIAFGTIGSGLLITDEKGNLNQIIDEKAGIISNNISCLYSEKEKTNCEVLWLCTDKGISKIEYYSPIKEFSKNYGIKGFVSDIIRHNNILYLATTEGVFYYDTEKIKDQVVFSKIENIGQSAWRFLKVNLNNGKYRLYVFTSGVIYEIIDKKAVIVKGDYVVNSCIQLESNSQVIYLGIDKGLVKANLQNEKLTISGPVTNSSITDQIRTIIEEKNGNLWLWGEKDGVMHYDTKKDTAIKFFNSKCDTTIKYLIYSIFKFDNKIYMCTSDGILEYNNVNDKFEPAKNLKNNDSLKRLIIVKVKIFGDIGWALVIEKNIKKIIRIDFSKGVIERIPYRRILDEDILSFYPEVNDFLYIGAIDKIYTFDRNFSKEYNNKFNSLVRKVTVNNDSVIFGGTNCQYTNKGFRGFSIQQNKNDIKEIKYKYHDLKFEYACPYFEADNALEYSYFLEGNDETWSEWTNKTEKEYTNLFEGEYIFKVKARNVHGSESEIAEYKFIIMPPWYRTIWAYISYLIILILIIIAIVKISVYRLKKINEAYGKYLPGSFLKMLDKRRVIDFRLGDMTEKEMTIMFSDIRSYTNLSESMAPHDNFKFLVSYLKQIGQSLNKNKGFPIQYYGDGIMAMFHGKTDNPIQAAIDMHNKVAEYSIERAKKGRREIKIGIGIHTGKVIMGIRGDEWRWEGGIVGDSVNIASRIEGLTKIFGVSTIITDDTYQRLEKTDHFKFRFLGKVQVKGKDKVLKIYELIDSNPESIIENKLKIINKFADALELFNNKKWSESLEAFKDLSEKHNDMPSKYYISVIMNIINGVTEINEGILIIN